MSSRYATVIFVYKRGPGLNFLHYNYSLNFGTTSQVSGSSPPDVDQKPQDPHPSPQEPLSAISNPGCNPDCRCHTPKQARVAIAGIVNNQDQEGLEVFQFHTSKYQNLKLNVRKNGGNETSPTAGERVEAAKTGPIALDSPLVTLQFNHQTRVYAITTIPDGEGNLIATVSPSFEVVGNEDDHATTKYRVLAGTGNGADKAWLYELEGPEGERNVREHDLGSRESQALESVVVGPNSQLAAFYDNREDKNSRYIVYSKSDGEICYKNISVEQGRTYSLSEVVATGKRPVPGTPLAACALGDQFLFFYLGTSGVAGDNSIYLFSANGIIGTSEATCSKVGGTKALTGGHISIVPVNGAKGRKGKWDIIVFYLKQGEAGKPNLIAKAPFQTSVKYERQTFTE
ncbi:hypothetical protein ABW20_dc0107109 [Dactylellina cionopaga]|nr:hypothetical protein ABW20_dc0107109 [Dactylellina cionopaga]